MLSGRAARLPGQHLPVAAGAAVGVVVVGCEERAKTVRSGLPRFGSACLLAPHWLRQLPCRFVVRLVRVCARPKSVSPQVGNGRPRASGAPGRCSQQQPPWGACSASGGPPCMPRRKAVRPRATIHAVARFCQPKAHGGSTWPRAVPRPHPARLRVVRPVRYRVLGSGDFESVAVGVGPRKVGRAQLPRDGCPPLWHGRAPVRAVAAARGPVLPPVHFMKCLRTRHHHGRGGRRLPFAVGDGRTRVPARTGRRGATRSGQHAPDSSSWKGGGGPRSARGSAELRGRPSAPERMPVCAALEPRSARPEPVA